ncbi:F0F1 ATP synthase subunit epsilon [Lacticaseibacillus sp. GG6-2]
MAELSNVLTVNVVTPDGACYSHHADMVVVRTTAGELGLMANHEPIVAPLQISEVRVKRTDSPGHEDVIAVNGGFMEMSNNTVSIVADAAERERDIDLSRAQAARERAQKRIEQAQSNNDPDELQRAQVALRRAINRIHAKTGQ